MDKPANNRGDQKPFESRQCFLQVKYVHHKMLNPKLKDKGFLPWKQNSWTHCLSNR